MKSLFVTCLLTGCAAPSPLALIPQVRAPYRFAGAGELVLDCAPSDAEVALDGVTQGVCSDFGRDHRSLKVGTLARKVEVRKSGYHTWESWLAADQTRVVISVKLLPSGGL